MTYEYPNLFDRRRRPPNNRFYRAGQRFAAMIKRFIKSALRRLLYVKRCWNYSPWGELSREIRKLFKTH